LPADFVVSPTFNTADLKPYLGEADELESRMTQMQQGEDDVDINTSDTLNNLVSSFLASYSSYLDNGNVYSVLLLRNDGQKRNGVAFTPVTFGFQNNSSL
jgi:hypothetical protein